MRTYYTYDGAGRKTAEIDADGSMTEFVYDDANRVIATVRYATAVSATNLALFITTTNPVAGTVTTTYPVAGTVPPTAMTRRARKSEWSRMLAPATMRWGNFTST